MESTTQEHTDKALIDAREQLFNKGDVGPIELVSCPIARITTLRGILFDLDRKQLDGSPLVGKLAGPEQLYENHVSHWIGPHPVLRKAEVRNSGGGLHVILRLGEPLELKDESDRARWECRCKIIQAMLPIDSQQPGLDAKTRPVGSINSKNGHAVTCLREHEGVSVEELLSLVDHMVRKPFATVADLLSAREEGLICPCCRSTEGRFVGFENAGRCYECGVIRVDQLYGSYRSTEKVARKRGR